MRLLAIITILLIILPGILAQHGDGSAYTRGPAWHFLQDLSRNQVGVSVDVDNNGIIDLATDLFVNPAGFSVVYGNPVGNTILSVDGNTGAIAGVGFLNGAGTAWTIGKDGSENFEVQSSLGRVMTMTSAGRVGIGNSNPQSTLDITGTIRISGNPTNDLEGFNWGFAKANLIETGEPNSITSNMIVDNSITSADINDNSITSVDIQDNTITSIDIQDNSIRLIDIDTSQIQQKITGTCPAGQKMVSVNADGSVNCVAETDPTVLASVKDGITWTEVAARPQVACPVGQKLVTINADGTTVCVAETDPTVPANIKDGITWTEVAARPQVACPVGQKLVAINADGTTSCVAETDPTVLWYVKDGTDWSEITNRPAGLDDGDQVGGAITCPCGTCWASGVGLDYANCVWNTICTPSGWIQTSPKTCPPAQSTPYLFSGINGNYLIENDVMNTFFQDRGLTIDEVRSAYESQSYGDQYAENEVYKLSLRPDIQNNHIKLQIREIEPEESMIDRVELVKVVHENGTLAFSADSNDRLFGTIKVADYEENPVLSCVDERGIDCLDTISRDDGRYLTKGEGQYVIVTFKPSGSDDYLYVNAWQNKYIPKLINSPLEDGYSQSRCFLLSVKKGEGWESLGRKFRVHSLRSTNYRQIDTGKYSENGIFTLKIVWDEEHKIDRIGMLSMNPAESVSEPLRLISAIHTEEGEVRDKLLLKDFDYTHIVRGDSIELVFDAGMNPEPGQEVDYFFVTQGYYYGLRTYLYPRVDHTDSYIEEIDGYVNELNSYLHSIGLNEVPHID